jgi:ABC-2 type transport system permease protein
MSRITLIARHELGRYLNSYFGWIILALHLMLSGLLFNGIALKGEKTSFDVIGAEWGFFHTTFIFTVIFSVIIAMRTFAAEREGGTLVLLQTSPASEWELVLGKYLGAWAFVAMLVAVTVYMPVMVMVHGNLQWGQVAAGYFGLLLASGAAVSIGVFGSALANNQILAVVAGASLLVLFGFAIMYSSVAKPPIDDILAYTDLYYRHFHHMQEGTIYLRSLFYYPSLALLFLMASVRVLESRRWR